MSCLLLKGSSENPAPPKEEVKGPEGGGLDIRLKSAKPSALLKDPLPKGSKVPKGPASSAREAELQGIRDMPSGVEGKCHLLVLNSPRSRGSGRTGFFATVIHWTG